MSGLLAIDLGGAGYRGVVVGSKGAPLAARITVHGISHDVTADAKFGVFYRRCAHAPDVLVGHSVTPAQSCSHAAPRRGACCTAVSRPFSLLAKGRLAARVYDPIPRPDHRLLVHWFATGPSRLASTPLEPATRVWPMPASSPWCLRTAPVSSCRSDLRLPTAPSRWGRSLLRVEASSPVRSSSKCR